jgi:ferrous iron transport protein B
VLVFSAADPPSVFVSYRFWKTRVTWHGLQFLLDKLMSRVGLHGKAFLPLMSSFACAIPGIMATRTIENRRDRFATILIAPFMSCSARLPVYTLMIGAFFAGQTVFGFISVGRDPDAGDVHAGNLVALIVAYILKRTLLKAPPPPFIMELPPYRMPSHANGVSGTCSRGRGFSLSAPEP